MDLWPLITGGKSAAFMAGGHVQALGSFCDTASHLPDCCSLHALVSDAEGPYLNSGSSFPIPTFRPAKLVTWQPVIPNGVNPLVPSGNLGYPNRARVGRQNERDTVMAEDPPTDLEEVVGGT
jgi:hypothetical protein